jgi:hypothetical protein
MLEAPSWNQGFESFVRQVDEAFMIALSGELSEEESCVMINELIHEIDLVTRAAELRHEKLLSSKITQEIIPDNWAGRFSGMFQHSAGIPE